jgi:hypothetical protein
MKYKYSQKGHQDRLSYFMTISLWFFEGKLNKILFRAELADMNQLASFEPF